MVSAIWIRVLLEFVSPILLYHLIVALCEPEPSYATRLLRSRPLQAVGEISFAIYLVHGYVKEIAATLVLTVTGCDTSWPCCLPGPDPCYGNLSCFHGVDHRLRAWLTFLLSAILTIPAAWVLTHNVEKPISNALTAGISRMEKHTVTASASDAVKPRVLL